MIRNVVAVFDTAAGLFSTPQFVPSLGHAVRAFGDEINNSASDSVLKAHPADFQLFNLGSFDDITGMFTPIGDKPVRLVTGSEVKVSL